MMNVVPQVENIALVETSNSRIKCFFAGLAEWMNNHWITKSIIQFFPSVWAPIIMTGLADSLGLKGQNGLTIKGWIGVCFVFGLSLLVTIVSNLKSKRDAKKAEHWTSIINAKESDINLYQTISDGEMQAEKYRLEDVLAYISSCTEVQMEVKEFVKLSFSPQKHLEHIANEIKQCFERVTPMRRRDFCVSMAISIDEGNWNWISQVDIAGCASLIDLSSKGSTFYEVSSGDKVFSYYNDKTVASNEKHYYMDARDKSHEGKGSIICWEVPLYKNGKCLVRLILSISTYGKCFSSSKETEIIRTMYEDKIKRIILDQFENEIKLDIALHYVLVHKKICTTQST